MEGAGDHFDFARHAGVLQSFGVREILIVKQVVGADADPCRRQPAQVVLPGRDGDLRVRVAEVGRPAELLDRGPHIR